MCGRYSEEAELSDIRLELKVEQLELFREFRPTYNIAPSYGPGSEQLFVVRSREGKRTIRLGRWWMIPHFWSKPLKSLPAAFNARAEDLARKPFWRAAFEEHRCLVPATGWREFRGERGKKQPYHFQLDTPSFTFAGLWSRFVTADGELVDSFAIITTEPNETAVRFHDRMPLVLPMDLHDEWLSPANDGAAVLTEACARSLRLPLRVFPTSPAGNNVHFEGPEVVRPVELPPTTSSVRPAQGSLFGEADLPRAPPARSRPKRGRR